jgi:hypothetical protein
MEEMRDVGRGIALVALWLVTSGCDNGISPSGPDLGGHWRGQVEVEGTPLDEITPLEMTLRDVGGRVTGDGGGADCRYFTYCGSFGSYSVAGNHDEKRIRLFGTSIYGPTWALEGQLESDGSLSGVVRGTDVPRSTWRMTRVR